MKARYVLWPVMVFGAVSLASACGGGGSSGTPDTTAGGSDGEGGSGTNVGATSNTAASDTGGMSTTDAGASTGGVGATGTGGASGGAGGAAAGDLCEGKNLDCPDDDNPCTEDECNPATGECGIPRSETACDDGVWCNGADTCDAGECTVHEGTSCTGTCNEAGDYCECSTKDDCPADVAGEWGACDYASDCAETVMQTRIVTKQTCNNVGKCVGAGVIESRACTRETDNIACTDNKDRCDGAEFCKNGSCVPQGASADPCKGNAANPYCFNADPTCRPCRATNAQGTTWVGNCSSGQKCCGGTCSNNSCLIAVNIIPITTSPSIGIQGE